MADRHSWNLLRAAPGAVLFIGLSGLGVACSSEEPATPPVVDVAPAAPPSRVGEVAGWDKTPVGENNFKDLLALADALDAEGTAGASAAAVRLRLTAVAALGERPPSGFEPAAQLSVATVSAEKAGPDGARLALAARMLEQTMALSPAPTGDSAGVREPFDGGAALALLDGPGSASIEADLVRIAARRALQALDRLPATPEAFADFARRFGAFACPLCTAAGAVATGAEAVLPCPGGDASPTCASIAGLAKDLPAAREVPNRVVIALLERLGPLADQPVGHVGLARSVELPARPRWVSLPAQFERAALPTLGGAPTPAGFNTSEARLVAPVTPAGVGLGHRATVGAGGTSPGIPDGRLASQYLATWEELAAATPADPAAAVKPDLRRRLGSLIPDGPAPDEVTVLVGLDPNTRTSDAGTALDALRQLSLGHFRFAALRATSPVPAQVPLLVRELPPALAARPESAPGSVVRVVLHAGHVDVWGPERDATGADGKPGVTAFKATTSGEVPQGLEQGWRGEVLARLRVPLQPAPEGAVAAPTAAPAAGQPAPLDAAPVVVPRLDDAARDAVLAAVGFFRQATGGGAVVHVSAAPEVSAGFVVDLARAVQEAPRPSGVADEPAFDAAQVWLGARCEGPASCPSTIALAFSASPPPGDRGLTQRPGEATAEAAKPAPAAPAAPPASEENCDRADINARMKRNTGRFRFCYEKELQLEKDLQGKAVVSFTIGLDGAVTGLSTGGDLPSKAVLECLGREVGKLAFSPPNGGPCQVRWPFVFKPN
jgi:hypothetical protein